ncbi:J domain-containing protein [Euzebya sp.]|uniref:J domain-containing protein n=1 Tax=Euzebya sp. TaxID=1971409 RepID=UPI0035178B78
MPAPLPDHYATLGVDPGSSHEDIRAAYRRLMRQVHPDVTGGDATLTQRAHAVTLAWSALKDPVARADYDRRRSAARSPAARPDTASTSAPGSPDVPAWGPGGPRPVTVQQLREAARRQAAYSDLGRVHAAAFSAASRRLGIGLVLLGTLVLGLLIAL